MEYNFTVCSQNHHCIGGNGFCKLCSVLNSMNKYGRITSTFNIFNVNDTKGIFECEYKHKFIANYSHKFGCTLCYLIDSLNNKYGNNVIIPCINGVYLSVNKTIRFHCNQYIHPLNCCLEQKYSLIKKPVCNKLALCGMDFYAAPIDLTNYNNSSRCYNFHFNKRIQTEIWTLQILEYIFDDRFDFSCDINLDGFNPKLRIGIYYANKAFIKQRDLQLLCDSMKIKLLVIATTIKNIQELYDYIVGYLSQLGIIIDEEKINYTNQDIIFKCRC